MLAGDDVLAALGGEGYAKFAQAKHRSRRRLFKAGSVHLSGSLLSTVVDSVYNLPLSVSSLAASLAAGQQLGICARAARALGTTFDAHLYSTPSTR